MHKTDKKLASNTVFRFLDWLFITLPSFFYWVLAGKTLSIVYYGIVSTSVNLGMTFSGISLFGFNVTLWKLLPEYFERKEKDKARELTIFSIKAVIFSNIVFALAILIPSSFLSQIVKIPVDVIFITVITMLILSLWVMFEAVLIGKQEMKKIAITDLVGGITRLVLSAVLIFLGFSYFGPLIGLMLGTLTIVLLRIPPDLFERIKKGVLNKKEIFFKFSFPAFISSLAWTIFLFGQYVLLSAIQNPEVTSIFTVAMLLTSPIVTIPNILSSALFPIISQLSVNRNSKWKQGQLIKMVFRYSLFVAIPVSIFLLLFSNQIILLFSSAEFLTASQLFPVLCLASLIYGCAIIFSQSLYSLGRPKLQRNIILMTVILFFILSIPLTMIYSALGMCIAYLISVTFIFLLCYINIRKIFMVELPLQDIKKILIAGLIIFVFLYTIADWATHIFLAIAFCLVAGVLYLTILLLLKFYAKEDILFVRSIVEKLPILKKQLLKLVDFFSRFI